VFCAHLSQPSVLLVRLLKVRNASYAHVAGEQNYETDNRNMQEVHKQTCALLAACNGLTYFLGSLQQVHISSCVFIAGGIFSAPHLVCVQ